ncbi:MAG: SHOCT domain-containing protein [Acidaminococcaceae bacterium]
MMGPWGNEACIGGWQMGGIFMMIMMIVFWLLVIAGGIALFRWFMRDKSGRNQNPSDAAIEHLKLRYVKGEISKEEFEQRKKDIQ